MPKSCICPSCLHPTAHHAFEDAPTGQRLICVDCPGHTCVMIPARPLPRDDTVEFAVLVRSDVNTDRPDVQQAILREVVARLEDGNEIPALVDLRGVTFGAAS